MNLFLVTLCVLVGCTTLISGEQSYHYGTKTAYRNRRMLPGTWREDEEFLHEKCKPVHITQIFRHGTRYPSRKQIKKINHLHARLMKSESGREYLPSQLRDWKNGFNDKDLEEKPLSGVGEEEMIDMGRRFRERYEKRMMVVGDNFHVITSNLTRAIHSSMSFLKGLKIGVSELLFEIKERLIRFFAYCDRYKTSVKKNKTALREYHHFKEGPEVRAIVNNIRKRFHLDDTDITPDDAELVFVMCGFEIANNISDASQSPWCRFFNTSEAHVLEYLQDIRQYWRKSYPYEVNIMQGCKLVADIIHHLQNAKIYWDQPGNFMLYFGHAETVLPVIGLLGLMKEPQHLRADNFAEIHAERIFRTAAISPFAANLALELYRCEGAQHWDYFVRPLVNEAPVMWNLCNRSFCPYDKVKQLLTKCAPGFYDHEEMCDLKTDSNNDEKETKEKEVRDEL